MAENILDKFILQFIVENKDAKKKLKEMVSEADKVHENLKKSTEKTDNAFKKLNKSIPFAKFNNFAKSLKTVAVAIGGVLAVKGISDLVMGLKDTAVRLNNLSNITGVSTTNLQIFGNMAKRLGIPVESMNNLFATMEQQLISLNTGANPQFAGALNRLGISARNSNGSLRSTVDIIGDLRKTMQGKTDEQQRTILATLNITAELLPLFKLSNEEYAKLQGKAKVGIMGDKDKKDFMKLNEDLQDMTQQFDKLKLSVGTAFLPLAETITKTLVPALEMLNKLIGVSKDFTNQVIKKAVPPVYNALHEVLGGGKTKNNLEYQLQDLPNASDLIQKAQLSIESGGNARAVGDKGKAFGLYQIHKDAAKDVLGYTPTDEELFNPAINKRVRDERLAKAMKMSGGNIAGALAYWHGDMKEFNEWKKTGQSAYASKVMTQAMYYERPKQELKQGYEYVANKLGFGSSQTSNVTNKTNNQSISIGNVSLPAVKSPQDFVDVFSGKNNMSNPLAFMNSFSH
jgi:hypothetical protein